MNQRGFTLIELICVMLLLGVRVAVGANFVLGRTSIEAEESILTTVITHMNAYEVEAWTNVKLSKEGWTSDEAVFAVLEDNYQWKSRTQDGGVLIIRDRNFTLKRNQSVMNKHGSWEVSS